MLDFSSDIYGWSFTGEKLENAFGVDALLLKFLVSDWQAKQIVTQSLLGIHKKTREEYFRQEL